MHHFENVTFNRVWPGQKGAVLMSEVIPMTAQSSRSLYRLMHGFVSGTRVPDDVRLAAAYEWQRRHEDRWVETLPWTHRARTVATILVATYEKSALSQRRPSIAAVSAVA